MKAALSRYADQPADNIETILPLTPTQQGLLFHTLLAPESGIYYEQVNCTFYSDLDPAAYRRAWETAVARHGVLRTCFLWDGPSKPIQAVFRTVKLPWVEEDWRALDRREQKRRLAEYLVAERRPGFHLSSAPLLRCSLFRTGEKRYEFTWSYHHLLLDGWSVPVLLREIFELYVSYRQGTPLALPVPRSYGDFLRWINAQDLGAAEAFWRAKLDGVDEATPLAIWREFEVAETTGHELCERLLDPLLSSRLQYLARECEVTLNTLIQAAWSLLLGRLSGRDDVVFGTTVSGRPAALSGVESMVGLFINALPTRTRIMGRLLLKEWFRALHASHVESEAFSFTPLNLIPSWTRVAPGKPLFDSLVIFENYPAHSQVGKYGDLMGVADINIFQLTNYALTLVVLPGERLCLRVHFETRRIEEPMARRVTDYLVEILTQFLRGADQPVSGISLLSDTGRATVLNDWSGRAVADPDPGRLCLHQLFEEQVRLRPQAIAVRYDEQRLSYEELNRSANRLAHRLSAAGIRGNVPVALAFERGIESIVALLGVLKAGAFYVPLEPGYPQERLTWILSDIQPAAVVCGATEAVLFNEFRGTLIVCDAGVDEADDHVGSSAPVHEVSPEDLCYVIYTSGSTGQPKGVCIEHRNVTHLFAATRERYDMGPEAVWTLFHSYAFDFSVWEIWGALLHGGRLEIVSRQCARDPRKFLGLLQASATSMLSQTPTAFRQLLQFLEEDGKSLPDTLRYVFFGGEALNPPQVASCLTGRPDAPVLVNMFGITETTVHVTERVLAPQDANSTRSLIGKPLPGYRVYVLDAGGNPVPVGVPGEIYVGGKGVSRGYYKRAELNRQRFIADPFEAGGRLYRSGDLGRYDANGELEYLGRMDDQVKIRGFRIELGEIEAALASHPDVINAAAAVEMSMLDGHPRLVGFYVPGAGKVADVATPERLREWLAAKLPQHAIPAQLVAVETIPLTGNGKLDRKALLREAPAETGVMREYVAPRTALEHELARIFSLVLKKVKVGITDNFFELGGDSILSIQILSAAHKAGLNFSLEELMRSLTIERLAPLVRAVDGSVADGLSGINRENLPAGIDDEYPLSAMQMGMLADEMRHGDDSVYHNVHDQKLRLPFAAELLQAAFARLFERHPVLRTSFDLAARIEPMQRVHRRVEVPLTIRDLRSLSTREQHAWIDEWRRAERLTRFDVTRVPLIRFIVHRLTDELLHFGTTKHHAILDGWSFNLMLSELLTEYRALIDGRSVQFDAPRARFRDLIEHERAAVRSESLRGYWDTKVKAIKRVELQSDASDASADRMPVAIPVSQTDSKALEELAVRSGASLKSVLLAVHCLALLRLTGGNPVTTGLVFNGRSEGVDGDRVLGLFLNSLPVTVEIDTARFNNIALVRQLRDGELDVFARRHYPIVELQRRHGKLFDVLFNFTHLHALGTALQGIEVFDAASVDFADFPLVVQATRNPVSRAPSLTLVPGYQTFSADSMARFAQIYSWALSSLTSGVLQ